MHHDDQLAGMSNVEYLHTILLFTWTRLGTSHPVSCTVGVFLRLSGHLTGDLFLCLLWYTFVYCAGDSIVAARHVIAASGEIKDKLDCEMLPCVFSELGNK